MPSICSTLSPLLPRPDFELIVELHSHLNIPVCCGSFKGWSQPPPPTTTTTKETRVSRCWPVLSTADKEGWEEGSERDFPLGIPDSYCQIHSDAEIRTMTSCLHFLPCFTGSF